MEAAPVPNVLPWVVTSALAGLSVGALIWSLSVMFEGTPADADYLVRPVEGLVEHHVLVMVVACLVGIGANLFMLRRRRRGDAVDVGIVLPPVLAGGFLGVVYAAVTAPGVGANIGAGLILLAAPVVLGGLAVWFGLSLRRRRTSASRSAPLS